LSFSGNQYPNFADKVITTRGDIIRGDSSGERARYGIGASATVLTSDGTDPAWAAAALAPTTTKGDISGYSTTQARIPISTNNYSLFADSAQALGLKWAASPTSTLTTTGDLLASSAANVLTRIAGGASGEVLTGNGAGVLPTFQAAGGGATVTRVQTNVESTFTTTSTTYVDVTNFTATLPNITDGFCTIAASAECRITVATASYKFSINTGAIVAERNPQVGSLNERFPTVCYYVNDADGAAMKMEAATTAGTLSIYGETDKVVAQIQILGVG